MTFSQQIKPFYEWIQKHIGMVIFFPTLIGGIWQLLELSSLGTAYIRFFSVSQLVSDGLMVCYILIWMAIMGSIQLYDKKLMGLIIKERVTVGNINRQEEPQETVSKTASTIKLIAGILFLAAFVYYFALPKINSVISKQILTVANLMDLSWYSVFFVIVIPNVWNLILTTTNSHAFFLTHNVQNLMRFIGLLAMIALLYFSLYFLRMFHNSFLIPSDFKNMDYIMCKVKRNNPTSNSLKIEYFNDKYVFIKLYYPKGASKTEVVAFDSFLDDEACKN